MQDNEEDTRSYNVVMNHEEQYSIWLTDRPVPSGWTTVGKSGSKGECLGYIEEVWTDMRPLSLRKHMEAMEHQERVNAIAADKGTAVTQAVCGECDA